MSNRNIGLDALKNHLFEALEGVKNLSDENASDNEKMNLDQAKAVVDIAGKIIDTYKLQVDAVKTLSGIDGLGTAENIISVLGVAGGENNRLIGR